MKQLGIRPNTKSDGLRAFQKKGYVLVDATYDQVNKHDKRSRDLVIDRDYPLLRDDLKQLLGARWKEVPLILIKANVCRLLEPKLNEDGFNVLNKGRIVPFPASGNQQRFDRLFRDIAPQCPCTPLASGPRSPRVA